MLPVVLAGAAALFGLYQYNKSKANAAAHPVVGALLTAPLPPQPGQAMVTPPTPATNTMGTIAYHPTTVLPGSGVNSRFVAVPPAPSGTTYPAANTVTDPSVIKSLVINWQAATPTPSNMYYYPADPKLNPGGIADIQYIMAARLGGTSKARITGGASYPKAHPEDPLSVLSMIDVAKLNGIVSSKDIDIWIKAGKPLQLPLGAYNDVSGPVPFAMGTIGPKR